MWLKSTLQDKINIDLNELNYKQKAIMTYYARYLYIKLILNTKSLMSNLKMISGNLKN